MHEAFDKLRLSGRGGGLRGRAEKSCLSARDPIAVMRKSEEATVLHVDCVDDCKHLLG